jgi:hypothetical protein
MIPLLASVASHHLSVICLATQTIGLVHLNYGVRELAEVDVDVTGLSQQLVEGIGRRAGSFHTGFVKANLPTLGLLNLGAKLLELRISCLSVDNFFSSLNKYKLQVNCKKTKLRKIAGNTLMNACKSDRVSKFFLFPRTSAACLSHCFDWATTSSNSSLCTEYEKLLSQFKNVKKRRIDDCNVPQL